MWNRIILSVLNSLILLLYHAWWCCIFHVECWLGGTVLLWHSRWFYVPPSATDLRSDYPQDYHRGCLPTIISKLLSSLAWTKTCISFTLIPTCMFYRTLLVYSMLELYNMNFRRRCLVALAITDRPKLWVGWMLMINASVMACHS